MTFAEAFLPHSSQMPITYSWYSYNHLVCKACAESVQMDCWWNAATENQAIDRVHRIGQERPVYVKHFIISGTIEGRILQIQKRKAAIVKEAFRGKGEGDPESVENLRIMFGDD